MRQSGKCIKCGSTGIVPSARVMDRTQANELDLRLRVAANPASLLDAWRRPQESPKG
jgi:hypothetical protein